jgi:hypothetical protein
VATLVFGMKQALDGYVDHQEFAPGPALFLHWIEQVRGLTGSVYGRRMYEVMRYWDEDHPECSASLLHRCCRSPAHPCAGREAAHCGRSSSRSLDAGPPACAVNRR